MNCLNLIKLSTRNCSVTVGGACSGAHGFIETFNATHLETTAFQKTMLGVGSALVSLASPWRGDMIATMGETTGMSSLQLVREKMMASDEGKRIIENKPRINSSTVPLEKLGSLSEGTVGKAYANFLQKYNYTPDARLAVRFVDDIELAYVVQRYREVHDIIHTILDMPTNMLGEVTVKWVEGIQTRLPMCMGGALFGAARLSPKFCRNYSTQQNPIVTLDSEQSSEPKKLRKHKGVFNLPCVVLPERIRKTLKSLLNDGSVPHVKEGGHQLYNYLQTREAPREDDQLNKLRKKCHEEVIDRYGTFESQNEEENEFQRKFISRNVDFLMKRRVYNWQALVMNKTLAYYYLSSRAAPEYAVMMRVFNEIVKRDEEFKPKSLFDFGSGVGTVTWAAHQLWGDSLKEYFTVDTSSEVNEIARLILQDNCPEKTPFVRHLFQRQFLPATARPYDIVVCAYSLIELHSRKARMELLANLWSKTNKYLIIVEHGTTAGFDLVEEARGAIIHVSKTAGKECDILAPCPHSLACPRVLSGDVPCKFSVTYAEVINHNETHKENFSYVIMTKSKINDNNRWPRVVKPILQRHHHVICRLCTSSGNLKEIIFTKRKHKKDLYKCVKYSSLGDTLPITEKFEILEQVEEPSETEEQRELYTTKYLPWAIDTGLNCGYLMNVYFEERWEQPLNDLLKELNIKPLKRSGN